MESGDTARALSACRRLESEAGKHPPPPTLLRGLGEAFHLLLKRRGYFVSDSKDLTGSLEEIHGMGEGFDLFDLASTLTRLDLRDQNHVDLEEDLLFSKLRHSPFYRPPAGGPPFIHKRRTP
jgi:hypothetical protein